MRQGVHLLQIPIKLSLALVAGGFVIFGAYGVYELRTEGHHLRAVIEEETTLLARSLHMAVKNALRDQQVADIKEMVKRFEHVAPLLDIVVYELDGRIIASVQGDQPDSVLFENILQTALQTQQTVFRLHPPDNPTRAMLAVPLTGDQGALLGGLVIVRSLHDMQHALQTSRWGIAVSVFLFVLTTSVLGLVLGAMYIGRPLGRMTAAMKEVRSGNLLSVLPIKHKDEIGAVAAEFNAMVADLRTARRQLEEEAESHRRLQRALQEADKLITIGQLSAGLAHEIGSPLQILAGRARALLSRAHDAGETRRNAEILVSQTERITRIVEHLLRFARRRASAIPTTDLATTVNSVLELLQYEARRRSVSLTFSCTPQLPPLVMDADGVQQIVLNLVANALIATPPEGSVTVSLETGALAAMNGGRGVPTVRLLVADTGCGMSAEVRAHLFEPFFTTRAAQGGTGLGLAVVKSLVTDHGGTIMIESETGSGTRFTVDLPVHAPATRQEIYA